ncbi:NADPH-dependent FMN reductase [Chitinophaga sp. 22536]|uniref:NADPH-dependent FMN reductase n=1 Tax=unclassified Chitinophaga TaxID=2619133 RepID=UPI003F876765
MNYNVIAFSGSLRKGSFTTSLVKAFAQLAPQQITVSYIDIGQLPFINEDLEANLPQSVLDLYETIEKADGVIFATPEYNRSYSPVLKNAIDWGSRPEGKNKWKKKPVAIVGCTPYSLGAFGAQNHLRQSIMYLDMVPLQQPEFYLGQAAEKFDAAGNLTDDATKKKIQELWQAFASLIEMHAEKREA